MTQVTSFLLLLPFLLITWFQPFYSEIRSLRQQATEIVLDNAIERAGVEGRFTTTEIDDMKSLMVNTFHYTPDEVTFTGTSQIKNRGDYIEGWLTVPSGQLWVFPGLMGDSTNDPEFIRAYAKQMSEYLPR